MALGQVNMYGKNKIEVAIDRYKMFEPKDEGYYLAYSGGKDSTVIKALARMAGVKHDNHYNITGIDPPELYRFIKAQNDVVMEPYEMSMFELIPKKLMPPTRLVRYCCDVLKERGGIGRFVITGVRWAESSRRKNNRQLIEFDKYGSQSKKAIENREIFLMNDNEEKRRMIENCSIKGKHILNPIVDWTEDEVWEFIRYFKLDYCELYDEGHDRLGCIGCPMQGKKGMIKDFEEYPKFYDNYVRAFERMLEEREKKKLKTDWKTGLDVMNWWIYNQ